MIDDLRPPYRIAFDNARDPYAARNALGIAGTGAGLITSVTPPLSVTGGNLTINLSGYVSTTGTPANDQIAVWTDSSHIEGTSTFTFDGTTLRTPGLRGSNGTASATAGDVGEFVQTSNAVSSGSLTSGVIATYHSISLTAGDWDVWMHSRVICAGTGSLFEFELTTGSSLSGNLLAYVITSMATPSANHSIAIQPVRFLLTSTTTINLNYRAGVTGCSINNAYIAARRRR